MVTACSGRRMVIENGVEANEMAVELPGLTGSIAEHLADDR